MIDEFQCVLDQHRRAIGVEHLYMLREGAVRYTRVGTVIGEGVSATCVRGGLPIFRNGKIEGACGVAEALSHEQEEECARAGIASILR